MNDTRVIHRHESRGTKRGKKGRFQTSWTTSEVADLRRLAPLGAEAIAEELSRSVWSVKKQAQRLRISLRRDGETRGPVLGQPRGDRLAPAVHRIRFLRQLRADVLAGRVDVERMERRVRLIARGAALCPECAKRPVEIERTGLCEDCHLDRLAWAHALEADRAEKDRQLLRERQRKSRARRRAS
jgi:hypothetical protein